MPTIRQKRLVEALPTSKTYTEALINAGYSENSADDRAKDIMGSKGVRELLKDLDITTDFLMGEYKYIAEQKKDLGNKRIVLENLLEVNGVEIKGNRIDSGNTLNYLQINVDNRQEVSKKLEELEEQLKNLDNL